MNKNRFLAITIASALITFCNSTVAYAAPQTTYSHSLDCEINEGGITYDDATEPVIKRSNVKENLAQSMYDLFYNNIDVDVYTDDPAIFFDADYYLANYPELATAVGTDYESLFDHYMNFGRFEGRTVRMGVYPERGKSIYRVYYPDSGVTVTQYPNTTWLNYQNCKIRMIEFLNTVVDDSMSEREIVTVIHDEICKRTCYDDRGCVGYDVTPMNDMDAFLSGTCTCVCQNYSNTFGYMCEMAGIECHYVNSIPMNHAWNRVTIDGIWYDIDVTWDDCLSNKDYFLTPAGTGVFADRPVSREGNFWFHLIIFM